MGRVLTFPKTIAPVEVRNGRRHRVAVQVRDAVRPRRTRWAVQFEIQEAAGFGALSGFTDKAVAAGRRHRFSVTTTRALRVFVAQTSDLVAAGLIDLWVDSARVRPATRRHA